MIAAIGASQEQLDVTYPKSGAAVRPDRMAWARTFLKLAGLAANPKRGVWVLTEEGRIAAKKSPAELKQIVNAAYKSSLAAKKAAEAATSARRLGRRRWSGRLVRPAAPAPSDH